MASSEENNVVYNSLDEIGSPTKFEFINDEESISSPPNNSAGTSKAIDNLQMAMKLAEFAASNTQKDIIIANLEKQIQKHEANEVKLEMEKIVQKQEIRELQKKNETLNEQMHGLQERHTNEMSKFHERMYENMSTRGEAKV